MLEEVGLPYRVHPVNIMADEQFAPAFLEISPNNKIPAIVDPAGRAGSRYRSSNRVPSCSTSRTRPAS